MDARKRAYAGNLGAAIRDLGPRFRGDERMLRRFRATGTRSNIADLGRVRDLSRLRGGAVDRRRGLAEQDRTLLRGADAAHVRVDHLRLLVGALDRRPRAHRLEPALEVREIGDVLALTLVRHD